MRIINNFLKQQKKHCFFRVIFINYQKTNVLNTFSLEANFEVIKINITKTRLKEMWKKSQEYKKALLRAIQFCARFSSFYVLVKICGIF